MRTNLDDIREEVQAGRITIITVKPVVLKVEARAHPRGIACRLQIFTEQGSMFRSEHIVPNLHALCAALGIDEQECRWQSCPQKKEPDSYVPFLFF